MCKLCEASKPELSVRLLNMNLMGKFFGYPDCCIQEFLERARRVFEAIPKGFLAIEEASKVNDIQKNYNFGFIPCIQCASKIRPGEEKTLIKNRVCKSKYPGDDYTDEEFDEFVKTIP